MLKSGSNVVSLSTGLPGFNLVIDYREDLLFRAGIYRVMPRADPSRLGFSRTFQDDDDDVPTSIADLIRGGYGSDHPDTQPLMSWNYDIAAMWSALLSNWRLRYCCYV